MDIHIQIYSTDLFKRSVRDMGIKLYNKLPEPTKPTQCSTVWSVSPSLPRRMLDIQQWWLWCQAGYIHTYQHTYIIHTHTYSFTEPLSVEVGLNIEFIKKRAKLK